MFLTVSMCVHPCVRVTILMLTCVYVGVRAYPPVCVCTFLGSARELSGAEKTPPVSEETDIDAEDAGHESAAELNLNRGVTDLDATAKPAEPDHEESKVRHPTAHSFKSPSGPRVVAVDNECLDRNEDIKCWC